MEKELVHRTLKILSKNIYHQPVLLNCDKIRISIYGILEDSSYFKNKHITHLISAILSRIIDGQEVVDLFDYSLENIDYPNPVFKTMVFLKEVTKNSNYKGLLCEINNLSFEVKVGYELYKSKKGY